MSVVDNIVFVTAYPSDAEKFVQICKEKYRDRGDEPGYEFQPSAEVKELDDNGNKCAPLTVFHLGLNYLNQELIEALEAEKWHTGTLLYIGGECYTEPWTGEERPRITVWGVDVKLKGMK